ncbi:MAG: non-ribosomal peptide synthetase [Gemmataceae bacterium]
MTFTSGPKRSYAPILSSAGILGDWAERQPNALALLAPDRVPLTYRQIWNQVEQLARRLNTLGLGRGDRIAVILPDSSEAIVTLLGVSACATAAPLNPAYQVNEFVKYLSELQPRALIIAAGQDTVAREVAVRQGISVLELNAHPDNPAGTCTLEGPPRSRAKTCGLAQPEDLALILFTGGTTSRPKLVPLSHRNVWTWAIDFASAVALDPQDRCLAMMPLYHSHGLVAATLAPLSAGGSIARTDGFNARQFWRWHELLQPTWYTAVPAIHQAILDSAPPPNSLSSRARLRFVRSGSAALPPATLAALEQLFEAPVIEMYGVTEAGQVTSNRLPPGERRAGTVGWAVGPDFAIVDEHGNAVPQGEVGEIVVRGPSVIARYASPPEANHDAFRDGWFRTGDQGRQSADGCLTLTGRLQDLINRGGEKIAPGEVENVMQQHPAVARAAVFAIPHPRLGSDIAAAVVLRAGQPVAEDELRAWTREHLAHFKVPRLIAIVPEIPHNNLGKVQRHSLAKALGLDRSQPRGSRSDRALAPRTQLEAKLAEIWQHVLKVESVGVTDDFFDLGGDSLAAMQLLTMIEQRLAVTLPVRTLLQGTTIERLAQAIEQDDGPSVSTVVAIRNAGSRTPFFAVHGVGGEVLFLNKFAPYLDDDQPLYGIQAPDLASRPTTFQSIEDLAACYLADIRQVQPRGPYFVGGFSLGGTIAYEIAQQIRNAGETVALLALIDNVPHDCGEQFHYARPRIAARFIHNALDWFRYDLFDTRPCDMSTRLRVKARSWLRQLDAAIRNGTSNIRTPEDFFDLSSVSTDFRALLDHLYQAYMRYRAKPYTGNVALFRAQAQALFSRHRLLPDMGLSKLVAGKVTVYSIPGTHDSILREPYVQELARKLQRALNESQRLAGPAAA